MLKTLLEVNGIKKHEYYHETRQTQPDSVKDEEAIAVTRQIVDKINKEKAKAA